MKRTTELNRHCKKFEQACLKIFSFLEDDYQYNLTSNIVESYGCFMTYSSKVINIHISLEPMDGGIFVMFSRVDGNTVNTQYDVNDLINIRAAGFSIEQDYNDFLSDRPKTIENVIEQYKKGILKYGKDILNGDTRITKEIDVIIESRRRNKYL